MIPLIEPSLEAYAARHSHTPSPILRELEAYTQSSCRNPEMVVGGLEAALLRMLVHLTGAQRVLEIGLFTGYSSLAMAEALPEGGRIISCEIDAEHARIAQSFFDRTPDGAKIEVRVAPALKTLSDLTGPFDLVFVDADKENYLDYYEAVLPLMRTGALLVADNVLWSGAVLEPKAETDRALVAFNQRASEDDRVETALLTVRDGVMLARKK